jgi:uncharacterized surface protein with fasciclin (FAS1) repeats
MDARCVQWDTRRRAFDAAPPILTSLEQKQMRVAIATLALALSASALSAQHSGHGSTGPSAAAPTKNIITVATEAGSFTTLARALQAAGLVETLQGAGPFTVFAPTDAAFAKLPAGTVEALLRDIPRLRAVLTYHVVAGKVEAKDVVKLTSATTVQGSTVAISVVDGKVRINDATVVTADVQASNGVIHVIDTVILPKN